MIGEFLLLITILSMAALDDDPAIQQRRKYPHVFEPLQISVAAVLPLNVNDPEVLIQYAYIGHRKDVKLFLPDNEKQVHWFRFLTINVDGAEPEYFLDYDRTLITPRYTRVVNIQPKEKVDLRVKLQHIWKLPATWQRIELRPKALYSHEPNISGTLIIERRKEK
jgi:hypothetical protein